MKKFYILLLSLFCIAHTAFAQISQEELMQEMRQQFSKFSSEDQEKMTDIETLAQTGKSDQLTQDDIDFYTAKKKQLIDNATNAIIKARKIGADEAKKTTKIQVAALLSSPQGPCPYTAKDKKEQELMGKMIAVMNEVVYYNKNKTPLIAAIASNAPSYKIESKATSPYKSKLALIDGTSLWTMPNHGKLTTNHDSIEPENEFEIELTALDNDQYQVDIKGRNVCNTPWDYLFQNAHRDLAICSTKYLIDKSKNENEDTTDATIQATAEGTDMSSPIRSTYCSDHHIQFICKKDHLVYSLKDALAPKKSSIEKYSDYRNAFCAQRQKEIDQEVAEQDAYNQKIVEQKKQFARDRKEWEAWWNGSKKSNPAQLATTNQADHKATDMQQLQQEESNKAR